MSKTLDLLKKAQAKMKNGPSLRTSKIYATWIAVIIFLTISLSNFGLTYKLFRLTQDNLLERSASLEKLGKMEQLLVDNNRQLSVFAQDLHSVNLALKDIGSKIKLMEETSLAQAANIENLIKAKNRLFARVSELEAQLSEGVWSRNGS